MVASSLSLASSTLICKTTTDMGDAKKYSFLIDRQTQSVTLKSKKILLDNVVFTNNKISANHSAQYARYSVAYDLREFSFDLRTGDFEVMYIKLPDPSDVKACLKTRSWGCDDVDILRLEIGSCKKPK